MSRCIEAVKIDLDLETREKIGVKHGKSAPENNVKGLHIRG